MQLYFMQNSTTKYINEEKKIEFSISHPNNNKFSLTSFKLLIT